MSNCVIDLYNYSSNTSSLRAPVILTFGGRLTVSSTVTDFTTPPSLTITPTSTQLDYLGSFSSVEGLKGLSYISRAKLQAPSINTQNYDAAAATARVLTRLDSNGSFQLYLVPGTIFETSSNFPNIYTHNSGNPYLLPGIWYLYTTLFLSPYTWATTSG